MPEKTIIEDVLRYAKLGLDLVTGIRDAFKSGKQIDELRVVDVIPAHTQAELAVLIAEANAREKFGTGT